MTVTLKVEISFYGCLLIPILKEKLPDDFSEKTPNLINTFLQIKWHAPLLPSPPIS